MVTHLGDFPYPQVTIRHLLSHTSGLPSHEALFDSLRGVYPDTVFTNADIIPRYAVLQLPLLYQPLDDYNYNNINYPILGLIIEKSSGMPLHTYMQEYIFKPAQMTGTFFPEIIFYHYTPAEQKNLSIPYRYRHPYSSELEKVDTVGFASRYWFNYNFEGFGEIISTTPDLFRYDQVLLNNKLLQALNTK